MFTNQFCFMKILKSFTLFLLATGYAFTSKAQERDSVAARFVKQEKIQAITWPVTPNKKLLNLKSFIIPGAMIVYGFGAIENDGLENLNVEFKEEMTEYPHHKIHLDNYLQFAPAVAVYGLNAIGIKGKHNFRDRTMVYLISNIILNVSVSSIKRLSHQARPDGSDYFSFPPGHTAEAFASAEFLRMEYKNVSPWYGIVGYAMAAGTGYLRMYNNKHWFSDVLTGAGIGIISTKLAYWLYPKIQHRLFKDKHVNAMLLPVY